jgi:hypothetical protein
MKLLEAIRQGVFPAQSSARISHGRTCSPSLVRSILCSLDRYAAVPNDRRMKICE